MAEITEELRVLVTAEVEKAIKNLKKVDGQTETTGKMFKALGKTIASAFSTKAMLDFAVKSVQAYNTQKEAVNVLGTVIKSTGAAAWTSSEELERMAQSLQSLTNYGDETIISMQSVLLGFKNIKGDSFNSATKAILDMATVMKMDLKSAAQVVGKALDDPANGLDSLRRQGFYFTESQKKLIQSFLDAGDAASAQKVILDELEGVYGGAAEAAKDFSTQVKNSFGDMMEGVGGFLSEYGRRLSQNGFAQFIGSLQEQLGELMGDVYDYDKNAGIIGNSINLIGNSFKNYWSVMDEATARVLGGEAYDRWFQWLPDEKKLKETERKYTETLALRNEAVEKFDREKMQSYDKELEALAAQSKEISDRRQKSKQSGKVQRQTSMI